MRKILCYLVFSLILISCNKSVQLSSKQEGVQVLVNGKVFQLPVNLEISNSQEYIFSHPQYSTQKVKGNSILQSKTNNWVIDMGAQLFLLKITELGEDGEIFIDGQKIEGNQKYLAPSTYQLIIKKPGYQNIDIKIPLKEDKVIYYSGNKLYSISNFPSDITLIELNGVAVKAGEPFPVDHNSSILKIHQGDKIINFLIDEKANYIQDSVIDLEMILKSLSNVFYAEMENLVSICGNWLVPLENPKQITPYTNLPFGFEDEPPLIKEKNSLVKEYNGFFSDVSIANPDNDLIGSKIVMETSAENKTIDISSDFLRNNTKDYYCFDFKTSKEGQMKVLEISNLDFHAPFHREICTIKLINKDIILDQVDFKENDSSLYMRNNHIGIYPELRNSFFNSPTRQNDNRQYLYLTNDYEKQYIAFYYSDNNNQKIPFFLAQLVNIDDSPVIIQLTGSATKQNFYFRIEEKVETLQDIKNSVYAEQGSFRGKDAIY